MYFVNSITSRYDLGTDLMIEYTRFQNLRMFIVINLQFRSVQWNFLHLLTRPSDFVSVLDILTFFIRRVKTLFVIFLLSIFFSVNSLDEVLLFYALFFDWWYVYVNIRVIDFQVVYVTLLTWVKGCNLGTQIFKGGAFY